MTSKRNVIRSDRVGDQNQMLSEELWVFYALVFGTALFAVQGLYWVVFRARHQRRLINRRLALTDRLENPTQVFETLRRERGLGVLFHAPILRKFDELVVQSGLTITPETWLGILFVLSAVFFMLLGFLIGFGLIALLVSVLVAASILFLFLLLARRRRIRRFTEQLPDSLDVIVRGLRAGHPFRVALGLVSREMPDPIGTEFGILADEIAFGLEQKIALDHLMRRVGQPDLAFLSIAVNIQSETGGNLAEILSRLSQLLRSRVKLRLKIRALSSEGRLSAVFLSAMPLVLVAIINFINPHYYWDVHDHPLFVPALVLCFLLMTGGNIVMYRMVNFKY
jgi:tight adherence protein B